MVGVAGESWPDRLAEAAQVALAAGRGALVVVVPDARDLERVMLPSPPGSGPTGTSPSRPISVPAERYRRWLAVRRGAVRAVIGTRAAAFAPVTDLGLLAIWDDGDDLYDEPRAPYAAYPRRAGAALVAVRRGAAASVRYARTRRGPAAGRIRWAHEIVAERAVLRAAAPRVAATGDDVELARDPAAAAARLP